MSKLTYINKIREFIARDDLDNALQELNILLQNTPALDEAIHHSGRYENVRRQIRLGTIDYSDANVTQNQIRYGLLELLKEIEKGSIGENLRDKIFIFYNPADRAWVDKYLVQHLENAGLHVHLDSREYANEDWQTLSRTVADCKATVLVFSGKFNRVEQGLIDGLLNERPKKLLALRLGEAYVFEEFADPVSLEAGESRPENFRPLIARLQSDELPVWKPLDENFIEISAMPNGGEHIHLFGRQRELQILDDAWAKRNCRVLSFTAQGGTGKSALFNRWLADMGRDHFRGAGRVLATSFYSQGTGERVTSADQFINFALHWFGERDFERRSPWDKGKRLAQLVSEHRTLLVLDGLEPLQEGGVVDTGKVKDPALFTLIRDLAKRNEGLCIITSRLQLGGLERLAAGIRQEDLEQISDEAGKHILRFAGIRGDDASLAGAVRQFGNHAFAVNLLGAWLYAQPGHKVEAAAAIADLPEVSPERGRQPRRVIAAFEKLLREKGLEEEVRLLRFLGLFDRPVSEEAIAQLHPFKNLYKTLDSLWMLKLIYREKRHPILRKNKEDMVDCHPLIREHYSEVFAKEEPMGWQNCHTILYEFYRKLPTRIKFKDLAYNLDVFPDKLEEMEPLFIAARHGCLAGLHQKVCDELYWKRILREDSFYLKEQLGAWSEDLALLFNFFEKPWDTPNKVFSQEDKALILSWAGYDLETVGKLNLAMSSTKASIELHKKLSNWTEVALNYSNLAATSSLSGNLRDAVEFARFAMEYADKSGDWTYRMRLTATYAWTLFNIGKDKEASHFFKESERILQENPPNSQFLYSMQGFHFCDLLLKFRKYLEVLQRTEETIVLAEKHFGIIDYALDALTIGKAFTIMATDSPSEDTIRTADAYLWEAVESLRKSGQQNHLPLGLLARARFMTLFGEFIESEADLEEVLDIAEPSGMRLHLTDYHLETAHLRLAQDRRDDARPHIAEAARLIAETGYHRRDKELEELNKLIET